MFSPSPHKYLFKNSPNDGLGVRMKTKQRKRRRRRSDWFGREEREVHETLNSPCWDESHQCLKVESSFPCIVKIYIQFHHYIEKYSSSVLYLFLVWRIFRKFLLCSHLTPLPNSSPAIYYLNLPFFLRHRGRPSSSSSSTWSVKYMAVVDLCEKVFSHLKLFPPQ